MKRYLLTVLFLLCSCSSEPGFEALTLPTNSDSIARGRSLYHGLAACGFCHGATSEPDALPSGGRPYYDNYGEVLAANITTAKSGIGDWEVKDYLNAIRQGFSKDGRQLSAQAHYGMQWMADQDLLSILAYLRTAPAIENEVEKREVDFIARNTTGFFEGDRSVRGFVPTFDPKNELGYGRYLVDHVARCGSCHSTEGGVFTGEGYLEGGRTIKLQVGDKIAPGITNSTTFGIGAWSEEQIMHYLKTGVSADNKPSDPNFCPVKFYRYADERDLLAIARYLRSDTESR